MVTTKIIDGYKLELCSVYNWFLASSLFDSIFKKVMIENSIFEMECGTFVGDVLKIICDSGAKLENKLSEYNITQNNHIVIEYLISNYEELENNWRDFIKHHQLFAKGFLPIGVASYPSSSLLLIGINDTNKREIWMELSNSGTCIKLGNSLCEFLAQISFSKDDFVLKKLENKILHKNFHEGFWRICD